MKTQKQQFLYTIWGKNTPNEHEIFLFERAKKYIQKIAKIPGIELIAIVNSLSMFATNSKSDIDIFIITKPKMLYFVRFFVTLWLWFFGVWRHKNEIAGNFCLSFFITKNAQNFEKIAISDDIYLYYWIYFLKPIVDFDNSYEDFLEKNSWVELDEAQKNTNKQYTIMKWKSKKIYKFHIWINTILQFFLEKKSKNQAKKLGNPTGIIISEDILKFHNKDQRENIKNLIKKGEKYKKNW